MATQKQLQFIYESKNHITGLTDVKAQVRVNNVDKAVGASAIVATEISAANSPGFYLITLTAANLTAWGVAAGAYSAIEVSINSVTAPAPASFRQECTVANIDDIDVKLGTPAGASVSADILALQTKLGTPAGASVSADVASVKSDTAAIKADLETGAASLSTILSNIQLLQNASIGNGVGFVLPTLIIPSTGSTTYVFPVTINNNDGALIDPTGNLITVGVKNSAGTDKGAFLTGSSGTPATVSATRVSVGQYTVTVVIPSTEVQEELIFSFSYTVGTNSMVRFGVSQTLADTSAAGYALQSTLLATQTTVNAINSVVTNATYGNAAIQAILVNGTYGLSALQTMIASIATTNTSINSVVTNATYGNAALQAMLTAMEGTSFNSTTDSLHAIQVFLSANVYSGGRAF